MSSEAAGMERAALAMLRTLGAGKASLLLTQPATVNGQCGLGLSAPPSAEVEMEPVLLQATVTGKQLLALATRGTVQKAINGADGNEATQILCTSMLRAGGTQYRIVSVTVKRFGGAELLYELEIEE
jgi:hypothetical protein